MRKELWLVVASLVALAPMGAIAGPTPFYGPPSPPWMAQAWGEESGRINITWEEPLDDGNARIQSYRVELLDSGGRRLDSFETSTGTNFTFNEEQANQDPDEMFYFRVYARNAFGESQPSNIAFASSKWPRCAVVSIQSTFPHVAVKPECL